MASRGAVFRRRPGPGEQRRARRVGQAPPRPRQAPVGHSLPTSAHPRVERSRGGESSVSDRRLTCPRPSYSHPPTLAKPDASTTPPPRERTRHTPRAHPTLLWKHRL